VDKAALVTGASRGIGAEIALRLAQEGYGLTIAARRQPGVAAMTERLEKESSAPVHGVVADMADDDDVVRLAREHEERFDRLDVLVLAAGLGANQSIADLPMESYDLQLRVNLRSSFLLIQQSLPLLRRTAAANRPFGSRVVALSSLTGVVSEAGFSAYGASKAGLISLCETLCVEESAAGVSATAISPGYVDTDMTEAIRDKLDPADMISTADVAELVLSLTRLSANAVVPGIVVTRPGRRLWRA
jgi:NAD(P)-dependent dehydrogenase (short-subunit alcohol dehydrogenase family)